MASHISLVSAKSGGRKSMYDLPIEYHLEVIDQLDVDDFQLDESISRSMAEAFGSFIEVYKRPSTRFGSIFLSRQSLVSRRSKSHLSRFQFLDPSILKSRLRTLPSYDFVREHAVLKLLNEVIKAVDILRQRLSCQIEELDKAEMPHRMFSWSRDDFLERRHIKNLLWLELLRMETPPDCLEKKKLLFDLNEMQRLMVMILKACVNHPKEIDRSRTDAILEIREAHNFLMVEQDLTEELARNTEAVRKYLNDLLVMAMSKHGDDHRRVIIANLEEQIMTHDIWDPIEVRYQLRYYGLIADQVQIKFQNRERDFEAEIERYQRETQKEAHCSQCTLDAMYADIEQFKTHIDEYSAKYKQEYELIDNQISYKKLSMEKLKNSRKYLTEQIQRFHEELELLRLAEIAAKQRQLEEEQRRLEELAAKAAAKKGKKGKKGGKKGKA